ncbi:MAG: class I SAM-dependent methyltransferase [Burkholderiales bacterium]
MNSSNDRGPNERAVAAAQAFLLATKSYWTTRIYPAVRAEYDERVARVEAKPRDADDVAALMRSSTLYQYYAWLERHLQRFKYAGRYGLHTTLAGHRAEAVAELHERAAADLLELHPELPLPRYYTSVDIHQHPGGVWSDPVAGLVYERGARSTMPLSGAKHRDLHGRLTDLALAEAPNAARILDLACGFGKSSLPFAVSRPAAQIDAIDLAAPCLEVAAREAATVGARNVRCRQMSATATDYANGTFDLVTSTMLLHELPPPEIERTFAEAARVLKPGGKMVHLDFLPQVQPQAQGAAEPFARFIHYGHGRRNNEPFMEPLAKLDLEALLTRLGFTDVRIEALEEAAGTLDPSYAAWRFPWTAIVASRA